MKIVKCAIKYILTKSIIIGHLVVTSKIIKLKIKNVNLILKIRLY